MSRKSLVIDSYYSFPGIILHELGHKWACESRGLRVDDYTLWNWRNGGSVSHEPAKNPGDTIVVSGAPVVVNTIVSVFLYAASAIIAAGVIITPIPRSVQLVVAVVIGWIAWSAGVHAIPSRTDASKVWTAAWRRPAWSKRQVKLRSIAVLLVGLSKFKPLGQIFGAIIGIIVCGPIFYVNGTDWRILLNEYTNLLTLLIEWFDILLNDYLLLGLIIK